MEQVVSYYNKMRVEFCHEDAMAHTLEMFEGLSEAAVEQALGY